MGRNAPMSQAEKDNLRRKALDRLAGKIVKGEKEKTKVATGNDTPSATRCSVHPGGDGGSSCPSCSGNAGLSESGGNGGSGASAIGTEARAGRKISKIEKPLEVVIDSNKFFNGLPAFSKLLFKAGNNILKIFNLIPFVPFVFEIEEMTTEEASLFAEAVRPGLEIALPGAGKKHPFIMLISAFVIGILGKLKATLKTSFVQRQELKKMEAERNGRAKVAGKIEGRN